MKILIVDDDLIMLETISTILEKEGFAVTTADSGYKALDLIIARHFDLIISDIMMPNLSGLTLLGMLKKHYNNSVPVILISSLDKGEIILSAMGMGADDFVLKPVNFLELTIRVKKLLSIYEQSKSQKILQ
jgi:DNA-binding response OmpR family regulator